MYIAYLIWILVLRFYERIKEQNLNIELTNIKLGYENSNFSYFVKVWKANHIIFHFKLDINFIIKIICIFLIYSSPIKYLLIYNQNNFVLIMHKLKLFYWMQLMVETHY